MKKTMFMILPIVLATITTVTAANWHNPQIKNSKLEDRQLEIDDGMCTAVASRSIPMPQIVTHSDGTHTFAGTATIWNGAGGMTTMTYNGVATPYVAPGQAFANGVANGMAIGNSIRARMDREKVYRACMLSLGWESSPVPQAAAPAIGGILNR